MKNPKKYNFILAWLPSRERQKVMPTSCVPYFSTARTAIEKLLLHKDKIFEVVPNYSPQEEVMTTEELSKHDSSNDEYVEEDFLERDCIHAIIYLASDYANYSQDKQEYIKMQQLPKTPTDEELPIIDNLADIKHTSPTSTLTLDEIDELNLDLHGSRNPIPLEMDDVKGDFDNIVKIILPIEFQHKYRINEERSIYNGIQGILGKLFQDDKEAEINLNVLIGGGTSAMRTIWFFTQYNKLFQRGGNRNLSVCYWDNQRDDNSNIQVKEAFIMDEVELIQAPSEQESASDYNDLPEKYKNKKLKEAVWLFERDIINHYMQLYHEDKHHVGQQLGYTSKGISTKLQKDKPNS